MKTSIIKIEWLDKSDDETIKVKTEELALNILGYFLPYGVDATETEYVDLNDPNLSNSSNA